MCLVHKSGVLVVALPEKHGGAASCIWPNNNDGKYWAVVV